MRDRKLESHHQWTAEPQNRSIRLLPHLLSRREEALAAFAKPLFVESGLSCMGQPFGWSFEDNNCWRQRDDSRLRIAGNCEGEHPSRHVMEAHCLL